MEGKRWSDVAGEETRGARWKRETEGGAAGRRESGQVRMILLRMA